MEGTKGEKSQTSASVFDEKSNSLFLTQLNRDGVACWNPKKELNPDNVALVARDPQRLIFTNDIKVLVFVYRWKLLSYTFIFFLDWCRQKLMDPFRQDAAIHLSRTRPKRSELQNIKNQSRWRNRGNTMCCLNNLLLNI